MWKKINKFPKKPIDGYVVFYNENAPEYEAKTEMVHSCSPRFLRHKRESTDFFILPNPVKKSKSSDNQPDGEMQ